MQKRFDFYEYAGIIAPGTALLFGFVYLFPNVKGEFAREGVTFGEFGLFLLLAYITGHLVQGIGNGVQAVYWFPWGGIPSRWIMIEGKLLAPAQRTALLAATNERFRLGLTSIDGITAKHWDGIVLQI